MHFVFNGGEIIHLDFLARPRGFAQEGEARLDAWVGREAFDLDTAPHILPAMRLNEKLKNRLQGFAVQRVF